MPIVILVFLKKNHVDIVKNKMAEYHFNFSIYHQYNVKCFH